MAKEEKQLIARSIDINLEQNHPLGEAITILQNALAEVEKLNGVDATLRVTDHYGDFEYSIEYKQYETYQEFTGRVEAEKIAAQAREKEKRELYERLKKEFE